MLQFGKSAKAVSVKKPVLDFQKEKRTDGTFQIIHISSGLHFFDKIEKDVVDRALSILNKIEIKWETGFEPPKDFISQCRKALRIAYKQAGIEIPNGLTKQNDPIEDVKKEKKEKKRTNKEEKTKKIIKRRDKKTGKTKKIIKRRDKKTGKEKKDKKEKKKSKRQMVYEFIQEQMVKGINISDLIILFAEEFDLSAKKANSRIKGNIRRMRKEGIEIMMRLTKKKEDDFYKIVK